MKPTYIIFVILITLLSSCSSKHKKGELYDGNTPLAGVQMLDDTEAQVLFDKVMATSMTTDNIVAKTHAELDLNGEVNSTSGTLRMKRGEGIQISLVDPLLGIMELGKLTFTPTEVIVIVRMKKQFVRVPYSQVSFLKKANIDFHSLQSLFWHELFEPGLNLPQQTAFTYTSENENATITFTDNLLTYQFLTDISNGIIKRTEITGTKDKRYHLWFDYDDFAPFVKKQFPKNIRLSFSDGTKTFSLKLELSSLKNNADWDLTTTIPDGYDYLDFEKIFSNLLK